MAIQADLFISNGNLVLYVKENGFLSIRQEINLADLMRAALVEADRQSAEAEKEAQKENDIPF